MKNENSKAMVEQVAILNVMGRGFLTSDGEEKLSELFRNEIVTPHNAIHVKIGTSSQQIAN